MPHAHKDVGGWRRSPKSCETDLRAFFILPDTGVWLSTPTSRVNFARGRFFLAKNRTKRT